MCSFIIVYVSHYKLGSFSLLPIKQVANRIRGRISGSPPAPPTTPLVLLFLPPENLSPFSRARLVLNPRLAPLVLVPTVTPATFLVGDR